LEATYKRYGHLQAFRKVIGAPPLSIDPIEGGSFVVRAVQYEIDSIQLFSTGSVNVNALNDFSDPLTIIHLAEVATFDYGANDAFSLLGFKDIRLVPRTCELIANGRIRPGVFTVDHSRAYEKLERFRFERIVKYFLLDNIQPRLNDLKRGIWDTFREMEEFEDSIKNWVEILDEIPRTPSKKQIQRVELRRKLRSATDSWLKSDRWKDDVVQVLRRVAENEKS
jgi:hypothetical protein